MKILGVKIDSLSADQIKNELGRFFFKGQHQIVLPYSLFLLQAQKDDNFKEVLNQASLSIADGFGPALAAKIIAQKKINRFSGIDLVHLLCEVSKENKKSIFLLGGQEHVAAKTARVLKKNHKGLKVAGTYRGFDFEDNYVINYIINSRADILLVALGMPKQEKWIAQNLRKMPNVKIAVGVGGAFDFISGNVKRAPKWMQKIGLEWLFRLVVQPWRIKKICRAVFGLGWLILKNKLKKNNEK